MALFSRRKDRSGEAGPDSAQTDPAPPGASTGEPPRASRRRTVGQLLRETREGYGSDIARVAAALRIRAAYLEAIEEARYDRLPGPVYALGFVRAYATHLGLDGEEAVRRFKLEAEGFEGQHDLSFPVPLAERSIPGAAMVLAALVLAVCGYGLWHYLSSTAGPRPERVSPVPAELARSAGIPGAAPAAATPAPPTSAAPAPAESSPAADTNPPPSAAAPAAPAPPPAPVAAASPAPSPVAPAEPAPMAASSPAPAPPPPAPVAAAPAPSPAAPSEAVAPPPPPPPAPAPAQTAALPSVPEGGATPIPDQPHVYGLANGDTRIVIHALMDSWIQVRDKDHRPIFTRQLHAGDSYRVPDQPGLSMRTGKGVGLAITVDGRQTPPIGGAVRPNVLLDPDRLLAGTAVVSEKVE
jgi:cytoskeleton protein RodZ